MALKRQTRDRQSPRPHPVPEHSKNKRYFQAPFSVLQLVTYRGLVSVPGRTNHYLEGPWQEYPNTSGPQYSYCGLSRYWLLNPSIPIVVLPRTDLSFKGLVRVPYLWQAEAPKKVILNTFCSQSVVIKRWLTTSVQISSVNLNSTINSFFDHSSWIIY